jgi:hypothetical protein
MGRSSGSSGGGGSNNNSPKQPRKQLQDKPIYTDAIIRGDAGARSYVATENKISEITKKQVNNPNRMQGSQDSQAILRTVGMKPGNYVTDRKGNAIRDSKGNPVLTSKGRKEKDAAMRRIPLSAAQVESQRKISNIITLPLMLVPGGGLIRAGVRSNFRNATTKGGNKVMTYGKGNLLTQDEANYIASQQETVKQNRPVTVDLSKRKRKGNLLTRIVGEAFGVGGSL